MNSARFALISWCYCVSANVLPPPPGPYAVSNGTYDLGGFLCGKKSPTVQIYYPSELKNSSFPIATYGHGLGGGIIPNLCEAVASLGFVVVAAATGGGKCEDDNWKDMLHALTGSKAKPSLHEALGHVDWSRAAVIGHSMGGLGAIKAVAEACKEPAKYNVKAGVASHGYLGDATAYAPLINVPMMFPTGGEDIRGRVCTDFKLSNGYPKILAMADGAPHMEPAINGRLNPFDAHFLGCHVAGLKTSCDQIYGHGPNTLCKANKMHLCEIISAPTASSLSKLITPPQECHDCFASQCKIGKRDAPACEPCVRENECRCKKDCGDYPNEDAVTLMCGTQSSALVV